MKNDAKEALDAIFKPHSVAVIGASNKITSWGFSVIHNILLGRSNEKHRIYPVNPNSDHVLGLKTYPRVTNIPDDIDLGIIIVRASLVPQVLEELIEKGARGAVIITASFSETGDEGKKREEEVVRIARNGNIRFVGPNGMGIYSAPVALNAIMSWISPIPGQIACISQSGNIGTLLLRRGIERGIGFRYYVSSGNEADLRVEDYLEYFIADEETTSILVYLESIRNGTRFRKKAQKASQEKPVIVLKGGKTNAGARATKSHTGSLAGDRAIYNAAFHQTGIIQAASIEEAWNFAINLPVKPLPQGPNMGIISLGGGWGVLASDACELEGLNVPPLQEDLVKKISEFLPPYWSKNNPIDTVALFDPLALEKLLNLLLSQDYIDGVMMLGLGAYSFYPQFLGESPFVSEEEVRDVRKFADLEVQVVRALLAAEKSFQKPVLGVSVIPFLTKATRVFIDHEHLPFFEPEIAARCLAKMLEYRKYLEQGKKDTKESQIYPGDL